MKWPWSKKETIWVDKHQDWEAKAKCHCGALLPPEVSHLPTLCPLCGCISNMERVTVRLEWEEEGRYPWTTRNRHWGVWSECGQGEHK